MTLLMRLGLSALRSSLINLLRLVGHLLGIWRHLAIHLSVLHPQSLALLILRRHVMIVLNYRRCVAHVRHRVVNVRRRLVRIAVMIDNATCLLAIR